MAFISDHQVGLTPLEALEFAEKLIQSARRVMTVDKCRVHGGLLPASNDYQTLVGDDEDHNIRTLRFHISEAAGK